MYTRRKTFSREAIEPDTAEDVFESAADYLLYAKAVWVINKYRFSVCDQVIFVIFFFSKNGWKPDSKGTRLSLNVFGRLAGRPP